MRSRPSSAMPFARVSFSRKGPPPAASSAARDFSWEFQAYALFSVHPQSERALDPAGGRGDPPGA